MKLSVKSLNFYLKNKLSTDSVVELLAKTEIEVEEVVRSNQWDRKIITAQVLAVEGHPDADRLRVATVDTGNEKLQIVCGAPNLEQGQKVVLAQIGSVLPDGMEIAASKLRGVMSHGMLCSASELNISGDHEGILVLAPPTPVGKLLCDVWESADILDIKTPANRWDYLSLIGIGREVAAQDKSNHLILPDTPELAYSKTEIVNVKEKGECRRFVAVKCRVDNSVKSPEWLVDNLEENGLRSISPVVDVTNFVMLETGQPCHAYDASKLNGNVHVRLASPAEKLTTLDGVERQLSIDDLVVADSNGPVAIAGVMGGAASEVDAQTREIFLEVANFDKTRVRRAAIRHGLRSEASARFERSLPLPLAPLAAARIVQLLKEVAHAEVVDSPVDQLYGWPWIQQVGVRLRRVEKLLGIKLDEKQVVSGLDKLGYSVEHFSITKEARKHLGKPYVWGANFKEHGESGFDCSYLVDRIYSRIGVHVGHVALGQFHHGWPVEVGDLRPGDVLFYEGLIKHSPTDHYYTTDANGVKHKHTLSEPERVGHNGIYVGNNTVVSAIQYQRKGNEWVPREKQGVVEVPLTDFTNEPTYLGARRYVENFNHILAITAPWWRTDVHGEEDVIEDIVKLIGYDSIPTTIPDLPPTNTRPHQVLPKLLEYKKLLVAQGLFEVVTYSFIGKEAIFALGEDPLTHLEIAYPLSREQQYLRTSILPSHLRMVSTNQAYRSSWAAFEIARVHTPASKGKLPNEGWRLGITVVGAGSGLKLKSLLDTLEAFTKIKLEITMKNNDSNMVVGRRAEISLVTTPVGYFGQIRASVLSKFDVTQEVSFAELSLDSILAHDETIVASDLPAYQLIRRDISLVCPESAEWSKLREVVLKQPKVNKVEFRSRYVDKALAESRRVNILLRVTLDVGAKPTTDEIQNVMKNISSRIVSDKTLGNITII